MQNNPNGLAKDADGNGRMKLPPVEIDVDEIQRIKNETLDEFEGQPEVQENALQTEQEPEESPMSPRSPAAKYQNDNHSFIIANT